MPIDHHTKAFAVEDEFEAVVSGWVADKGRSGRQPGIPPNRESGLGSQRSNGFSRLGAGCRDCVGFSLLI